MTNADSTFDLKPAKPLLTTSHSRARLPGAWHAPFCESTGEEEHTATSNPRTGTRKTKIFLTVSPEMDNAVVLRNLLEAGVSGFRLDLSRVTREAALKAVYAIRSISTELQQPVSLLLDTKVPPGLENDWTDVRFGLEAGVDWLAAPDDEDGQAIRRLRQFLTEAKRGNVGVLGLVARAAGLANLDSLIRDADGISSCPTPDVRPDSVSSDGWCGLVRTCTEARKLAVLAVDSEAELSSCLAARPDALWFTANFLGTGDLLARIHTQDGLIQSAENRHRAMNDPLTPITESERAVAAAMQEASQIEAGALVMLTRSAQAAAMCAALRPSSARVVIFTPDSRLARKLRARYALESFVMPSERSTQASWLTMEVLLRERQIVPAGAKVVFLSDGSDSESAFSPAEIRVLS